MAKNLRGFSVPSVEDIREANTISAENKPILFQKKVSPDSNPGISPTERVVQAATMRSVSNNGARDQEVSSHQDTVNTATGAAPYNSHAIIANASQKKNPLMKFIRNIPWEVGNIVPDFELGKTTCALYISVRYHLLHPDYIHGRLKELGKMYLLRILLVHVDTSENQKALKELAKIALLADLTLMLAWSNEEAARYLETYKAYENKPPDILKERTDSDFSSRATECLTTVKKLSKTDAATLINSFKTMEKLINSSKEDLTLCPGLGPQKAQRLHSLFHESFLKQSPSTSTN